MSVGRAVGRAPGKRGDTIAVLASAFDVDLRLRDGARIIGRVTRHLSECSASRDIEIAPAGMPPGTRVRLTLSEIGSASPIVGMTFATRQKLARDQRAYVEGLVSR